MLLEKLIFQKSRKAAASIPQIFDLAKPADRKKVNQLLKSRRIAEVVDDYEEQLREYFAIENPPLYFAPDFEKRFKTSAAALAKKKPLWQQGKWVYFPWLCALAHILEHNAFFTVRTARNRNLITAEEQKKFYDAVVGIAGLSVGNSIALAMALEGGGRRMRLVDHDRLALSNTNRIRSGIQSLGLAKIEMTARQIYELNPYAKLDFLPDGLNEKNIEKFFAGPPKLDVVIDEIDNLPMKYLIRQYAQKYRIPVVMATDNGDNGLVDIERYDINPDTAFFHGRMGERITYQELAGLDKFAAGAKIAQFVGLDIVPQRMIASLKEIGKTIVSWPQLGVAALLNGSAVAYCVRKIVNGEPLANNRAFISLDDAFTPRHY